MRTMALLVGAARAGQVMAPGTVAGMACSELRPGGRSGAVLGQEEGGALSTAAYRATF